MEAEFLVEPDSGVVVRRYRQRQFPEFHRAKGVGGSLHEHAAEAVSLVAGHHADLRGVTHAGRDFAGQHGRDELIAARLVEDEGRAGDELPTAGKQNDVF